MTDVADDRSTARHPDDGAPIVEVDNLTVAFGSGPGAVRAVENVSLTVRPGDIYALVGESGCGKSTLAYALLDIVPPPGRVTEGEVRFKGAALERLRRRDLRRLLGLEIAMVFQAAMNAFNPVITIGDHVEHVLQAHPEVFPDSRAGRAYFEHLLELVRLPPAVVWDAFESQLSGGMKQRVAIALALLLKPSVVVLDEPTTALDVLNQRLVIDILRRLHRELGITIIFVTHDLAVVAEMATRVAVMYAGRLVEAGTVREIFGSRRRHPYVRALVDAIPSVLDKGLLVQPIAGEVPNLADLPPGCRFAPRCRLAQDICVRVEPPLLADGRHLVACHVVNEELEVTAR
ncbi:peptide/nickel transport system ATP-binding protein [Actinopolymorpha cephalotaxi]|uniref:Peptide/nickel transport system ATP-binding protein n=1 Tax=Actinopolymorpha cephalotaxi TaxID=504797 RepID=A0A1I2WZ75_9ACTN|nr:ABC transporter ATP-binding protein [Actinopolymorpha cephalotaxi]NYH85215.1 peptide/nickel transport system ATP-binding protein [Actinopolymorpha cephalotaxi]SFH06598.1 peptide/nickel transport system ATP-binding protein [Actinopolymorpha cephalotaxi]